MTIKNNIQDPSTGEEAIVQDGCLTVTQFPCPPLMPQKNRIFRQYLTDDGTSTGDEDMRVAATLAAPQEFYIQADNDSDRYITTVSFVIADDGAELDEFGALAALTNGCRFYYESLSATVYIDFTPLKTNWDFVRMAFGQPAFGDGKGAFLAKDVEGKVDAYIPIIDFIRIMPPYGIKLDKGSIQRLVMQIRDNTSAVDSFNAIAYGFDRFQ